MKGWKSSSIQRDHHSGIASGNLQRHLQIDLRCGYIAERRWEPTECDRDPTQGVSQRNPRSRLARSGKARAEYGYQCATRHRLATLEAGPIGNAADGWNEESRR